MSSTNNKIVSYRSNALIKTEEQKKPLYGIIKASKPHQCRGEPGFWKRLFLGVHYGSLFRCRCGKVYRFSQGSAAIGYWVDVPISEWIQKGGRQEEQVSKE